MLKKLFNRLAGRVFTRPAVTESRSPVVPAASADVAPAVEQAVREIVAEVNAKTAAPAAPKKRRRRSPDDPALVRAVRDVVAEGHDTYNAIAKVLNARYIFGPQGGRWGNSTVKIFLERHAIPFETKGLRFGTKASPKRAIPVIDAHPPAQDPKVTVRKSIQSERITAVEVADGVLTKVTTDWDLDPLAMLSPNTAQRAGIVARHKRQGGKAVLTAQEIDEIQRRIQAGEVTRCPPGIDSDGYNHFTGEVA